MDTSPAKTPSDIAFSAYPGDSVACPEKVFAYLQSLELRIKDLEARFAPAYVKPGSAYDLNSRFNAHD